MESLYKAKNIEICYEPRHHFLYCNWQGFQSKESIMNSGAIILEIFRKRGLTKVLNDNTSVTGPWQECADWTSEVWFPEMIDAGLRHFAWIFSPNTFAKLSAVKAMPDTQVIKTFSSYHEAHAWLIAQPQHIAQ